ncbi:hypothetical protein C4565_10420 [Candidatus Parcubacteria bacterium]|nr:MAG: hypothetical protein C4565_10420 [Candidatus Parcubacteria bacterium]
MNDCSRILEEELTWREAELSSLKRIAIVNGHNQTLVRATLRACWALLYAHYEGFTKFCWELLLDEIQNQNITIEELSEEFKLLALEKSFRNLRGDISSSALLKYFNLVLPNEILKKAVIPPECRLDTECNLWPNVFERECSKIGVVSVELQSRRQRIKTLVSRRNDIAHGKNMTVRSVDEYSEYENATFLVLYDLAVQVLEIIESKAYLT